jgi:16S rRNA (adenine1518-N6/adenine1519-N6)-dimethyltransferase
MVQKEVARELAARPGKNSLLSISIQVYAEAEYLFDVRPEAFDPPPSIMSGVVRLVIRDRPLVPPALNEPFFDLVARTFRNPRKQVHNALSRALSLAPEAASEALVAAGIEPSRRPETLSVDEWLHLLAELDPVRRDT